MLCSKEIKAMNSFKRVHLQRGRDLFARFGPRLSDASRNASNIDESIPIGLTKMESLEYIQAYDRQMEIAHVKKMQEEYARKMAEEQSKNNPIEA